MTSQTADELLNKVETSLVKVEAAQGSSVKLTKAENDFLVAVEKLRDFVTKVIQDPSDKDRSNLKAVFGGNCMRIAKGRAMVEASKSKLTEKSAKDPRVQGSLGIIETVEHVLRDVGLSEKLAEAQGASIPWRPPGEGGAAPPAPAPPVEQKAPPAPEPAPVPEPAPAPAPAPLAPAQPDMNPTLAAPKSAGTREVVVTSEAEKAPAQDDGGKHKVEVEMSVGLEGQSFDFGPDKTFNFMVPKFLAKVNLSVNPPFPDSVKAKPFEPEQVFTLSPPEMAKMVFDPAKNSPPGGKWTQTLKVHADLLDIPGECEVDIASKSTSPWGGEQLFEGKECTQMHYQVQIDGEFTMEQAAGSTSLGIDLTFSFACAISGAKTEGFSSDGAALPTPEPGSL
eukprot:CAMPEP_0178403728 /NCGR_PEP_ID=MMETSP0689_2-20121128/17519_1 /TAXON_ID=160604 /ORGANISM="Amphidinium massartii, Strain CS-259" /LENGTH=393 /DNA_ID=CAMNT_0020024693 /DNA_START=73 /DNA_END=1254 /DNA_ORIENTATION=-